MNICDNKGFSGFEEPLLLVLIGDCDGIYRKLYCIFRYLGFKDFIGTSVFDDVMNVFMKITQGKEAKAALYKAGGNVPGNEEDNMYISYNRALDDIKINIMSDSVVVSTPCKQKYSLAAIIDMCYIIQYFLLECKIPMFFRGAISKGDIYQSYEMMFGKGMIEAYVVQEKISKVPRIIISKEIVNELHNPSIWEGEHRKLNIGRDGYYYINCIGGYLDTCDENLFYNKCEKMKCYIEKYLNSYIDNGVREKILWIKEEYIKSSNEICKKYTYDKEILL